MAARGCCAACAKVKYISDVTALGYPPASAAVISLLMSIGFLLYDVTYTIARGMSGCPKEDDDIFECADRCADKPVFSSSTV